MQSFFPRGIIWRLFLLSCFVCCAQTVVAQTVDTRIYGRVVDAKGEPLQFVNVLIEGTIEGAASDQDGYFSFVTERSGILTIRATMIGFEPFEKETSVDGSGEVEVNIKLRETLITMEEAFVTASAYATGDAESVTLQSLEVITTPGAAADIFLAIKTLPGVAMVDEGAGLFVRGGDVSETVLLLDQATVAHPYKYESPTGGVFGTIPPFLVAGTVFSSGGFSARYGNALSGVLAMTSQNMPLTTSYTANLGLAAASAGVDAPLIPGKLGVRFSANQSFTGMMMRVNGFADEFLTTPRGTDVNLSLIYQYSPSGRIKLFNYTNHDRVGVFVDEPSFEGVFRGKSANWLHNLQWSDIVDDWLMQVSLSLNRYENHRQLGSLDLRPSDTNAKLRVDLEKEVSERVAIAIGGESERTDNAFRGQVPVFEDILDPATEIYELDDSYAGTRWGAYAESEMKLTRRIAATIGLRADYYGLAETVRVDPRLAMRYAFSQNLDLRLAWGRYHQGASAYAHNSVSGNPSLTPLGAQHMVAGLSYEKGLLMVRGEAYYKWYDRLVLEDPVLNFANTGDGSAYGIDAFIKYGAFLATRANGWISYSYLQSDRRQTRRLGDTVINESGPSPFDITHNLTIVGKVRLFGLVSAGMTYRYATGRPFTPVTDAVLAEEGSYYLPVEGAVGSERLPDFQRLDANLSYYLPFGRGHNATIYLALSNLLNRVNVLDYEYNLDYSKRRERRSNYRRFVYFGVAVNFNRVVR